MNKSKIIDYWNKRATSFSQDKQAELKVCTQKDG